MLMYEYLFTFLPIVLYGISFGQLLEEEDSHYLQPSLKFNMWHVTCRHLSCMHVGLVWAMAVVGAAEQTKVVQLNQSNQTDSYRPAMQLIYWHSYYVTVFLIAVFLQQLSCGVPIVLLSLNPQVVGHSQLSFGDYNYQAIEDQSCFTEIFHVDWLLQVGFPDFYVQLCL